jgi:hypothetical protein
MTRRRKKRPLPRTPVEVVLPRVRDKLQQARFHLERLISATTRKDMLEIKSYLGGCLCAAQAALAILEVAVPRLHAQGISALKKRDRVFLDRMTEERNDDVHESPTALRQNTAITPGGNLTKATEFRFRGRRGSEEVGQACERFISLIEGLTTQGQP